MRVDRRGSLVKRLVSHWDQMVLLWAVRWEKLVELMAAYLVLKMAETKVASTDSCLDLE